MRDAWLGRLFVRFRDRRDGRALAAVFDATARELIGVAAHLVPTADLAEDAVQATFQRAIERAASYDGERSLKGWLYGILWREAAKLARAERRAPPRGELAAREPEAPEALASERELPESVRRALARIPSPYREVLEPALLEERSAREIAARLARSPGTVRVQLRRGLERLRRELPSARRELAGPGASSLLGLAPLRARVLRHADVAAAAVPAASAAFLAVELASAALPPLAWSGAAAAAVVAGAVALGEARAPEREPEVVRAVAAAEPPRGSGAARELRAPAPVVAAPGPSAEPEPTTARREERPAAPRPPPPPVVDPQVTGVVLDAARRPLAGIVVQAEAEDHYGYAETWTDALGRFAFGGLAPRRWYVYVDDEPHARMWWRTHGVTVPDETEPGAPPAELELVLRPPHALRGTLVDPRGAPVAGATVTLVGEAPAETGRQLQENLGEDLLATASDADGTFAFERLGAGAWWAVVAHPEFACSLVRLAVPGDPPRLVLDPGMTLEGVVLAAGAPLADVPVYAHSTRNSRRSVGDWEARTDAAGRFRIEHVARAFGERTPALSLRVDGGGWTSDDHHVYEGPPGVLPAVVVAAFPYGERERGGVRVGDVAARDLRPAVGSGAIRVTLAGDGGGTGTVPLVLVRLDAGSEGVQARGSLAPGSAHAFEALLPGRYRVLAEARDGAGFAPETLDLAPGERREVALRAGAASLAGRVTSAGAPVDSGWIVARSIRNGGGQTLRAPVEGGTFALNGLEPGSYELHVGGPGALTWWTEVELGRDGQRLELEVPSGRVEGRLAFDRAAEGADFRVMVFPYGWYQESGSRGVVVDPDADGRFVAERLPPGDYAVWAWRARAPVTSPVVTVSAAVPVAEVVLARPAALGTIAGRIEGRTAASRDGLSVAAHVHERQGLRRTGFAEVGPDGSFRVDVEPGRYSLLVSDFSGAAPFTWLPDVVVGAGATTDLAVSLPESRRVAIALDAGGAWTPRSSWRLRMPDGAWLPFVHFIGSETEGRRAGVRPFGLPLGSWVVEADFGDAAPVARAFEVVPGEGVQEVRVERP